MFTLKIRSNFLLKKEEIFGPILPIINIESVDEAIELINSRDKPLGIYNDNKTLFKRKLVSNQQG